MIRIDSGKDRLHAYGWVSVRGTNRRRHVGYAVPGDHRKLGVLVFLNALVCVVGVCLGGVDAAADVRLERFNEFSFVVIAYLIARAMALPVKSIEASTPAAISAAPPIAWAEFATHVGTVATLLVTGLVDLPRLRPPFAGMLLLLVAAAAVPVVFAVRAKAIAKGA